MRHAMRRGFGMFTPTVDQQPSVGGLLDVRSMQPRTFPLEGLLKAMDAGAPCQRLTQLRGPSLPFPNARHLAHPFQWKNTLCPPPKSESSASKIFRYSDITLVSKTTFAVFTRAGPDNSLAGV
jgi:hypothetical protein